MRGARVFKVRMKDYDLQNDYEYLVLHAESEKVYFMNLITTAEKARLKLFDAVSYGQVNEAAEELRRVKVKVSQSKKLLAKMSGKLAELLRFAVIES